MTDKVPATGGSSGFDWAQVGQLVLDIAEPIIRNELSKKQIKVADSVGRQYISKLSLTGVGRTPHFKEFAFNNLHVCYFEYPSEFLIGRKCQIDVVSPFHWTSHLHHGKKASIAREHCKEELLNKLKADYPDGPPENDDFAADTSSTDDPIIKNMQEAFRAFKQNHHYSFEKHSDVKKLFDDLDQVKTNAEFAKVLQGLKAYRNAHHFGKHPYMKNLLDTWCK